MVTGTCDGRIAELRGNATGIVAQNRRRAGGEFRSVSLYGNQLRYCMPWIGRYKNASCGAWYDPTIIQ